MATPRARRSRPQSHALQSVPVPLKWQESGMPFVLADQIFARWSGDVYQLTFGVVPGPPGVNPNVEELQKTGLNVYPVARVAITPANMGRVLGLLNTLHNTFSPPDQQP
jgi:hypothetical protein